MKRTFTLLASLLLVPLAALQAAAQTALTLHPIEAKPLLLGNWADPTILKDGNDYYMTHSSFEFQPGLLVSYRDAAGGWTAISPGLDISGANHNNLGGWYCVRPALFSCGTGQARFHSFTYRALE